MPLQSAYRQNCSTETALLHVHDSVIRSIDERKGVIMLLIYLSAAFDTIDHDILLNTLSNTIGVKDRCLSWFAAYLQHRQYTVLIAGEQSRPHKLTCGVPQGSVLGPLLFTIYMTPLASLLKLHGMTYHLYADDTQLFQEFSLSDNTSPEMAVRKMERCVTNIRQWMKTNMLKLNDDKTEILIIRPKSANQHLLPERVRIGNTDVTPNTHARHLVVTFDCNMSLERHVTNISRTAYYHLHSIGRIRRYLEQGHTKQLVHALVISRIDCCNSLLNYSASKMLVLVLYQFDQNETTSHPCSWSCTGFLLSVASHSRPYFSPLNASMVLHLHTYQHFSLPIARHAVCGLLTSYYLISPLPELNLANDPSLVRLQGHGTNYPLLCDNVRL